MPMPNSAACGFSGVRVEVIRGALLELVAKSRNSRPYVDAEWAMAMPTENHPTTRNTWLY